MVFCWIYNQWMLNMYHHASFSTKGYFPSKVISMVQPKTVESEKKIRTLQRIMKT